MADDTEKEFLLACRTGATACLPLSPKIQATGLLDALRFGNWAMVRIIFDGGGLGREDIKKEDIVGEMLRNKKLFEAMCVVRQYFISDRYVCEALSEAANHIARGDLSIPITEIEGRYT